MAFVQRLISLSVQLAPNVQTGQPNTFVQGGIAVGNTVTISGLRTSVRIKASGAPSGCTAEVKVWGMSPSLMYQMATLGLVLNLVPKNQLTIMAGNAGGQQAVVFTGTIFSAYADYDSQPDVPFIFTCLISGFAGVVKTPPLSVQGAASVVTLMKGLARQANIGFLNYGVPMAQTISNQYLRGTIQNQIDQLASNAGITHGYIKGNSVLAVSPFGRAFDTPNVPVISKATGMVNYPAFTQQGIIVKTLFNPDISFNGLVQVESNVLAGIAAAQGQQAEATAVGSNLPVKSVFPAQWAVQRLDLALDSMLPGGDWLSVVYGYVPGSNVLAPG